ncbi:MAG TPA: hypothetical protein VN203_14585, partial [Candidatus Acidoferrum sp.]|nr:hypothetical protein [Candidatus Acidoferrum sp.]
MPGHCKNERRAPKERQAVYVLSGMDRERGGKMKNLWFWTRLTVAVVAVAVVVSGGALFVDQGVGATPKASSAIPDQP